MSSPRHNAQDFDDYRSSVDAWSRLEFGLLLAKLRARLLLSAFHGGEALDLQWPLIVRHATPFFLADRGLAPTEPAAQDDLINALAALLEMHTFSLTELDHHIDGVREGTRESQVCPPVRSEIDTSIAALHSLLAALAAATASPAAQKAVGAAVGTTIEVFDIMTRERDRRYDLAQLTQFRDGNHYRLKCERMRGSGYWEVMIRGRFGMTDTPVPTELIDVLTRVRRLRQLADEVEDFADDFVSGLITMPVFAAIGAGVPVGELAGLADAAWHRYDLAQRSRVLDLLREDRVSSVVTSLLSEEVEGLEASMRRLDPRLSESLTPMVGQRVAKALAVVNEVAGLQS